MLLPKDVGDVMSVNQLVLLLGQVGNIGNQQLVGNGNRIGAWMCCLSYSPGSCPIKVWLVGGLKAIATQVVNMTGARGSMTSVCPGVSSMCACLFCWAVVFAV